MKGSDLKAHQPVRMLYLGYPGAGKTGSLAALADAGWKLRVIDFDGNTEPLIGFTKTPEGLDRIDVATFEDKLRIGAKCVEPVGIPHAFSDGWKMLDRWKYVDPFTGEETDLGASRHWGPDTILVLDSLTSMGRASMWRSLSMANRTLLNRRDTDWGTAMAEQEALVERVTSKTNRFHIIVTAHLKLIAPKEVRKGDDDLSKQVKQEEADIIPTRLWPSALGRQLPREIAGHFPTVVLAEQTVTTLGKTKRMIHTASRSELDLKVPVFEIADTFPIETGMVSIFNKLTGGFEACARETARLEALQEKANDGDKSSKGAAALRTQVGQDR